MAEDCTLVLSLLATCITTFPSDLDLHVKVSLCGAGKPLHPLLC